jgi:hypothetical protein
MDDLKPLTTKIMQIYIKEKNLELPHEVYLQRELIFNHRAQNGIQFIRDLEARLGDKIEWKIEEPFQLDDKFKLNGRIDCLGLGNKYLLLLDFKSTEFSASSNTDVADYEALQLWAYAHASEARIENKTVIMGYVVLDDSSKSNLLTSDEETAKIIKDSKLCKSHRFKEDFSVKLKEAQEKMIGLSLAIQAEKEYKASPRKAQTCDFCELNKVCVKSELTNV